MLSTGSTQEGQSQYNQKFIDWDVNYQIKQKLGAHFKYFQVQTACESPDLNFDFCSFDNGLIQLYK